MRVGPAAVLFTGRAEGDLRRSVGDERRRALVDRPWTVLRQVHGAGVVVVDGPGQHWAVEADAAVTRSRESALAVLTADCAPVAIASDEGVLGVAHAGWRGLVAGVLPNTIAAMKGVGATTTSMSAVLGPCIHSECYEFSEDDLAVVAGELGEGVRSTTDSGRPALDVPAAVRASLASCGIELVHEDPACTACDANRWFSHRARGEPERQALVAWLE